MPTAQTTAARETVAGAPVPVVTRPPSMGGCRRPSGAADLLWQTFAVRCQRGVRAGTQVTGGCGDEERGAHEASGGDAAGRGPSGGGRRLDRLPGTVVPGAGQRDDA